ncbi:MAG: hypothetical protein AB7T63_03210 [Planctomycetota bacterium]
MQPHAVATRVHSLLVVALAVALASGAPAAAGTPGAYVIDLGAPVRDVRLADVEGDAKAEMAVLLTDAGGINRIVTFRAGQFPTPKTFFRAGTSTEVPLAGALSQAGTVAFARFPDATLRVFHGEGFTDVAPDGTARRNVTSAGPTLLARDASEGVVFHDGAADLDGDGLAECWFPLDEGEGRLVVRTGDEHDVRLELAATNRAGSEPDTVLQREAEVPALVPADLDGDGRRELVTVVDGHLLGFDPCAPGGGDRGTPVVRLPLPFLLDAPAAQPGLLHTPRLQLADVDGDGASDLLVTLITGRTDKLGSLKTILFQYPGPLRAPGRTELGAPRARIDTPSVVLHPVFEDLDGDGALDYIGDSIRDANLVGLAARMLGKDPPLTLEAFRFDKEVGAFETVPHLRVERLYPSSEALGNRFRANAFFGADLDGDGKKDLLDLGTLGTVTVLGAGPATQRGGTPWTFERTIVGPLPVEGPLEPAARFGDLDGDGATDVALFGGSRVYLLVSGGKR